MNRRSLLRAGGAAVAGLAGCLGDDSQGPERIAMTDDLRFDPASLRVAAGETIEWWNDGTVRHTVTAEQVPAGADYFASGGYESEAAARDDITGGLLDPDETFTHTPSVAGEYRYVCIPHEGSGMTGSFRVR